MPNHIDPRNYNRDAWNRQVESGTNPWTQPVSPEVIARARQGQWDVLLTEQKPVPHDWFPPLAGLQLLGLACGGGQQGPVFAAAGAHVTIFDNSPAQLARDREVAAREGLTLRTVEGDASNLSAFADESFDLVFNPVSIVFMADARPVWKEAFRVLKPGGLLLTGFINPVHYIFDLYKQDDGILEIAHSIPYSDLTSLSQEDLEEYLEGGLPLEFGHSLTDLIGGQIDAGFLISGFYEDSMKESPLAAYHPNYIATRAIKPATIRQTSV